jgi:hypothetical protein
MRTLYEKEEKRHKIKVGYSNDENLIVVCSLGSLRKLALRFKL